MGEKKFTLKRGLKNVMIAAITADNETEYTTGAVEKLIPAGELSVSVDNEKATFYFDNSAFAQVGKEGDSEATISGASLRASMIAYITGKTIDETTGAVLDNGMLKEKYFALGAEMDNIDGTKELVWFNKGSFAIPDTNAKTEDDSTDANGNELTFTAIKTQHSFTATNEVSKRVVIDTAETVVKESQDWFAQVVTPDNISTICEKVATETVVTPVANAGTEPQ